MNARSIVDKLIGEDHSKPIESFDIDDLNEAYLNDYEDDSGIRAAYYDGKSPSGSYRFIVLADISEHADWCVSDFYVSRKDGGRLSADFSGNPIAEGTEEEMRKKFDEMKAAKSAPKPSAPPATRSRPFYSDNPLAGMSSYSARRAVGHQFGGDIGGSSSNYR